MTNRLFAWNREDQGMGQTKIRASTRVFCVPCFALFRCRSEGGIRALDQLQAEASGHTVPSISAWLCGSATRRTRIQASGGPMEDTWPARVPHRAGEQRRLDSIVLRTG